MLARLARRAGRVSIAVFVSVTLTAVVTLVLTTFALYFYQVERAQRWEQLHKTLANSADELAVAGAAGLEFRRDPDRHHHEERPE
jgi:predicted PurR-regulated permease PerM